jgi:hypothetical protein
MVRKKNHLVGSNRYRMTLEFSDSKIRYCYENRNVHEICFNEKCRINSIAFYPVEIKSDHNTLMDRIIHQVLNT